MLLAYLKLPDNKVLTALRAFVNVFYAVFCLVVVELAAYLVLLASDGELIVPLWLLPVNSSAFIVFISVIYLLLSIAPIYCPGSSSPGRFYSGHLLSISPI